LAPDIWNSCDPVFAPLRARIHSVRTSVLTPYAAYLRVYEPLDAFRGAARRQWAALVTSGDAPDQVAGAADEHRRALTGLLATPPAVVPPHESGDAFVLTVDGRAFVCPFDTRLRAWSALEEFMQEVPTRVAEAFVPPVTLDEVLSDHRRWLADAGPRAPHILTNTWFVPLRWFIPFVQRERVFQLGSESEPRAFFFRTPMVEARRRVARALRVLERTIEDGPIIAGVIELGRWLEEFHPHAWVELDYGGLVQVIDDDALAEDDSAAIVAEAVRALAAHDPKAAASAYARLMERWRMVQALEHAS
jgi:hypothetical protein